MAAFECFNCHKVISFVQKNTEKCPSCGSPHGQIISNERLMYGLRAGVFFNIDPNAGKRAKKKK